MRRGTLLRSAIIGLLCLLSIGLEACRLGLLATRVTREDIVGVWEEERCVEATTKRSTCGYFMFFPDGRFQAHDIPTEGFGIEYYGLSRASDAGSWELASPPQDPFFPQQVNLTFDRYGDEVVYIYEWRQEGELAILANIIDGAEGIFIKTR
ncbi:MAG: hypothetical protein ONB14_12405 [candidate division KSB1 bacterium]|nr:hypothetical protein [candidate division KSB1 bacterium]